MKNKENGQNISPTDLKKSAICITVLPSPRIELVCHNPRDLKFYHLLANTADSDV